MTHIVRGVDVSSKSLDARVGLNGPFRRFDRSPDGVAALAAFCRDHAAGLVVMEATGGYERLPFALLWDAGLPVAIVNPRAVRAFAEGLGFLRLTKAGKPKKVVRVALGRKLLVRLNAKARDARAAAFVFA